MNTHAKDSRVDFRLPGDIKAVLQQAAELVGKNLSEFLIDNGRAAASDILTNRRVFVTDTAQADALEDALNSPVPANEKLVSLMSQKSVLE